MVDGISFISAVLTSILINNPLLNFKEITNRFTGETWTANKADYRGMFFKILSSNSVNVYGSIHKYAFNGSNITDFTIHHFIYAIKDLCILLGIDPYSTPLCSFEVGINISIPGPADKFLNGLIWHRGKRPNRIELPDMHYISFDHFYYCLKIYDKNKQYGITSRNNLIRIELKVKRMRFVESLNISMLSDLLDESKILAVANILVEKFSQIIFFDYAVFNNSLDCHDEEIIQMGKDPDLWAQYSRSKRHNRLKEFRQTVVKRSKRNLQEDTCKRMRMKIMEMQESKNYCQIHHPL